jgi:hypothetical protein
LSFEKPASQVSSRAPTRTSVEGADQIDRILLEAERALCEHVVADNRIAFPVSAHLLIAQKR